MGSRLRVPSPPVSSVGEPGNHLAFATDAGKEVTVLAFLDHEFVESKDCPEGTNLWAASRHLCPRHGWKGAQPFPRVLRLQGWGKLAPAGFRVPEEAVAALALMMVVHSEFVWGISDFGSWRACRRRP